MTSQSMENNLAVTALHDPAPVFSKRIFDYTDAFEDLDINLNVGLYYYLAVAEVREAVERLPWRL